MKYITLILCVLLVLDLISDCMTRRMVNRYTDAIDAKLEDLRLFLVKVREAVKSA